MLRENLRIFVIVKGNPLEDRFSPILSFCLIKLLFPWNPILGFLTGHHSVFSAHKLPFIYSGEFVEITPL